MTVDLPRLLLAAYRAAAGVAGTERARAAAARASVGSGGSATPAGGSGDRLRSGRSSSRRDPGAWSGAGQDARDPQRLESSLSDLVSDLGWSDAATAGQLQARWEAIVGPEVAEHSQPVRVTDGDLLVRADSTAWATQLALLSDRLLESIQQVVGESVRTVRVEGPGAPRWRRGPLRVPGRGPRDTYG